MAEEKYNTFEEKLNRIISNGVAPVTCEPFYLKSNLLKFFSEWKSKEEVDAIGKDLVDMLIQRNDELLDSFKDNKHLKKQLVRHEKAIKEFRKADEAQVKEIIKLKSKGVNRDLLSIPKLLADWIESDTLSGLMDAIMSGQSDRVPEKVSKYLNSLRFKGAGDYDTIFNGIITLIARVKLDGYRISQVQMYKLRNNNTGNLLFRLNTGYRKELSEQPEQDFINIQHAYFSDDDLKSIDTGSYDVIPVEGDDYGQAIFDL